MAEHKPTVERDENGVPTSWLLVRAGPIPLRKNGEEYVLELTSKDLSGIVNYQRTSGEKIPIDSNHYLHMLAQKHGIEESDALKIIPSGVSPRWWLSGRPGSAGNPSPRAAAAHGKPRRLQPP